YPFYSKSQFDTDRNLIWISRYGYSWSKLESNIFAVNLSSDSISNEITLPENSYPDIWTISGQRFYYFNRQTRRFWYSSDLGTTWDSTEISVQNGQYYPDQFVSGPFGEIIEYPDSSQIFFIYPGSGIWISRDYGQTWNNYSDGLTNLNAYQIAFSSQNPDWAYLVTADGIYRRQLSSTIDEPSSKLCSEFRLFPNYPNPFNSGTAIRFDLLIATDVEIRIYDLRGTLVQTIRKKHLTPGTHTVQWNAGNLSSGIYFYQVHSDQAILTRKCLLIK
ncbi:MAG: T9SS type A sorting domain-containing protein, partial [Candidatus Neomarinimicrobiota bacterium]